MTAPKLTPAQRRALGDAMGDLARCANLDCSSDLEPLPGLTHCEECMVETLSPEQRRVLARGLLNRHGLVRGRKPTLYALRRAGLVREDSETYGLYVFTSAGRALAGQLTEGVK